MADTAIVIFHVLLSTPGTYMLMMDEFGINEKQMGMCFNQISNHLYHNYAYRLSKIEIWEKYFETFAKNMTIQRSPFPNFIGFVDRDLMQCAPPGGAGNWISTIDQLVIYSGKQTTQSCQSLFQRDLFLCLAYWLELWMMLRCFMKVDGLSAYLMWRC